MHQVLTGALAAPLLAADCVIAVSNAVKAFLSNAIPRLRHRTVVVYNGLPIPPDDFPVPLSGSVARLAVIGRLNSNKGQDLAIAAVDALAQRGRDVRLELAGDTFAGSDGAEPLLREAVRDLGLERRVTFAGFCRDIWALLRRTDIVLAPSRTDSLPLVVIEAMLARRPVIAAEVGGIPELIEDGVTGILVPRDDVASIIVHTEALLDDPPTARRLGDRARAAAVDRFGNERFKGEIVEVVENVLASRPARRAR